MSSLIDEIVASRTWRLRELEQLKKVYVINIKDQTQSFNQQYLRMCIPYIYAHWEGFVVESFKLLIDYINNLKLENTKVTKQLLTFSHLSTLRTLSGKQSFSDCTTFIQKFCILLDSKKLIIDRKNFSTKSNLNYKQLQTIFSWFDLDRNYCKQYETDINNLVNQRNQIAHGENGIIIEYKTVENYVLKLQEIFDMIIIYLEKYIREHLYLDDITLSL